MESIIPAIIAGGASLIGVIITNISSNKKIEIQLDKQLAVTKVQLDNLTQEVRMHNNFAQRIPVIEEQLKRADDRLEKLERKHET